MQGSRTGQLEIGFVGASETIPHGSSRAASQSNYLLGSDPSRWRTHVPNYRQVVYSELYPGIDAVFYGNRQRLVHDFVVSPGADYRQIREIRKRHTYPRMPYEQIFSKPSIRTSWPSTTALDDTNASITLGAPT